MQHIPGLLQYFCFCYYCMFSVSTKLVNFLSKVIPMFVSWFAGFWFRLDILVLRNKRTVSVNLWFSLCSQPYLLILSFPTKLEQCLCLLLQIFCFLAWSVHGPLDSSKKVFNAFLVKNVPLPCLLCFCN